MAKGQRYEKRQTENWGYVCSELITRDNSYYDLGPCNEPDT